MSIGNIMREINESVPQYKLEKETEKRQIERSRWAELLGVEEKKIYLYKDKLFFVLPFYSLEFYPIMFEAVYNGQDIEEFELTMWEQYRDTVKAAEAVSLEYLEQNDYTSILTILTVPTFGLYHLQNLLNYYKNDKKMQYEIWRFNYQTNDYNHIERTKIFFKYYDKKTAQERVEQKLKDKVDKKGYLTIYRGQTNESTPETEALSWTFSKDIALFFANRYPSGDYYELVEAKVHIRDIYDTFYDSKTLKKEEYEVLVNPKKVKIMKRVRVPATKHLFAMMSNTTIAGDYSVMDIYHYFRNAVKDSWFVVSELHGVMHAKRVLCHALVLGLLNKCTAQELYTLGYAALYHDIGRTHDEVDDVHGELSVKKRKELDLPIDLLTTDEAEAQLEFIMATHNIGDKLAYAKLEENSEITDKKQAKKLYQIFCDADGLDRVRLGDLALRYLRTEQAPLMEQHACLVLRHVE